MKYKYLQLIVFSLSIVLSVQSQSIDITTLYQRVYDKTVGSAVTYGTAQTYTTNMQPSGVWTDIDYTNTSNSTWTPQTHLDRLMYMARSYSQTASPQYNSTIVRDKIVTGLKYWKNFTPTSINWYFNDISAPSEYSKILVLLKGKLDNNLLLELSTYLEDKTPSFVNGGENLVWIAEVTQNKGIVEDSDALITTAIKATASTLTVSNVDGVVGIKVDNSYHLHGTLLYSGGYGLSSVTSTLASIELVYGTKYYAEYTASKLAVLGNYVLDGLQRMSYKKIIDFCTVGRYIARTNETEGISIGTLDRLIKADPVRTTRYTDYKNYINGTTFKTPGTKFFFKSDIMTRNGANYYMSARMISKRTIGTETTNGENRKGSYLPIGATNFYTSGNEYYNIFPTWDWARVPGITAEDNEIIWAIDDKKSTAGTNSFSGGVSNGTDGICAFDGNYNSITARKAYFIFGDAMVCLGMGITSAKANPIVTSVNQCFVNGTVTMLNGTTQSTLAKSTLTNTYTNLKWVHQDNIGYIFPQPASIIVKNADQSGAWYDINVSHSKTVITNNVFSLWFNHTNAPTNASYQYIVAPNRNLSAFQTYSASHGFEIVANSGNIQAVKNVNAGLYGVVFYSAGTVNFGADFTVAVDKPAIILISGSGEDYKISVADPLYGNYNSIKVTINKSVTGVNATNGANLSTIIVSMPTGDLRGSTVTNTYKVIGINTDVDDIVSSIVKVHAYPNPSIGGFSIDFLPEVKQITVTNLQGKIMFVSGDELLTSSAYSIGNDFPVGMYILTVLFKNAPSQSIKLIKSS